MMQVLIWDSENAEVKYKAAQSGLYLKFATISRDTSQQIKRFLIMFSAEAHMSSASGVLLALHW